MKYAVIAAHVQVHAIALMCRVLGVAPSGFYAWRKAPLSPREKQDRKLATRVRVIFGESHRRYGSPRIHSELRSDGVRVGRKRVARLMRREGLVARHRRRFVSTTQSRHDQPIAPNLLQRQFSVEAPNKVWVSDLTYLRCSTGFAYLAVVLDLFSRRVVGWAVSQSLTAEVATTALRRAIAVRPIQPGMIHHSDRGIHYACDAYRRILSAHQITPSMSRKGNCWDNAVAESFFSSLGYELEHASNWRSLDDLERALTDYIEAFYNPKRRHSHNGFRSPVDFERSFRQEEALS